MDYDVIIVGAGPGGSSAAIRMAERGVRVLLLEEKRMPREKLCGEFITPESFPTLKRLAVFDRMLGAGAQKIARLCLVASDGKMVHVPVSDMSYEAAWAMSLSRARFDHILFDRARELGVHCLEGMAVKRALYDGDRPAGVEALSLADGKRVEFKAPLVIDASGRNSRLLLSRSERTAGERGSRLYAMKAHLKSVEGIEDQVELFFFPQGYGGLSLVEGGLVNLCFIAAERTLQDSGGDAGEVVRRSIMKNRLARERLAGSEVVGKWHSVGPLAFGHRRLSRDGIIAVGDASGMIDPFTGTGIQIALRTGEIAAEAIVEVLNGEFVERQSDNGASRLGARVLAVYQRRYDLEFNNRMMAARLLRGAAFSPRAVNLLAGLFARVPWLARRVLLATRSGNSIESAVKEH